MKTVAIVFALALLLRLLALAVVLPKLNPDADLDSYRSLARSLATGNGFTVAGRPNVARTPVYPAFLAALMHAGSDRLGLFLAAQCALGALVCALTVALAARWLSAARALAAGALVAIDPNSIVRCVDLRTETLFTLLLLCGACLLAHRPQHRSAWFGAGLLWSLAALCRPIALFLWVVPLLLLVAERLRPVLFALFLLGFVPPLAAWAGRNAAVTGQWFVSSLPTYHALFRAAELQAGLSGRPAAELHRQFAQRFGDGEFVSDRAEFLRQKAAARQTAWQILREHPLRAAGQTAAGWAKLLFGPGARSLEHSLREPAAPARLWPKLYAMALVAWFGAAVAGACRLGRAGVLLVALAVYFVALAGGPGANSRFRVPLTPMLAVLAVAAVARTGKQ